MTGQLFDMLRRDPHLTVSFRMSGTFPVLVMRLERRAGEGAESFATIEREISDKQLITGGRFRDALLRCVIDEAAGALYRDHGSREEGRNA